MSVLSSHCQSMAAQGLRIRVACKGVASTPTDHLNNMKIKRNCLFQALCVCTWVSMVGLSTELRAQPNVVKFGVAYIPGLSSDLTQPIPSYIRRIGEITNNAVEMKIYPFQRSIKSLEKQREHAHVPLIYSTNLDTPDSPYRFSTATLWYVNFVLYTHKSKSVDLDEIDQLELLTDTAHTKIFDFKVKGVTGMEGAIQMVNKNRVDGLIFADSVIDPIIKAQNLKNVRRTLFKTYDVKALILRGENAEYVDKMIAAGVEEVFRTGEIATFKVDSGPYQTWQPFEELP